MKYCISIEKIFIHLNYFVWLRDVKFFVVSEISKKRQHFQCMGNTARLKFTSFTDTKLGWYVFEFAFHIPEFQIEKSLFSD